MATVARARPALQVLLQESRRVRRGLSARLAARPRHVRTMLWHSRRTASAKQSTVHTRLRYAARLDSAAMQSAKFARWTEHAIDLAYGSLHTFRTRLRIHSCLLKARTATARGTILFGIVSANNMRQVLVLLGAQLRRRVPRELPVGRLRCSGCDRCQLASQCGNTCTTNGICNMAACSGGDQCRRGQ